VDRTEYVQNQVSGIEFNPDVALSAMLRLAFEGGCGAEIWCANALLEHPQLDNSFDVVLTNPPFGSKGKVEDQNIRHYRNLIW
jgi:type I restriction enzyme M protein